MRQTIFILAVIGAALATSPGHAQVQLTPGPADPTVRPPEEFSTPSAGIWNDEVGGGFRSSVQTISLEVAEATSVRIFGSTQPHELALASLSYGHMLGGVKGEDRWYRGNWEIRAELFAGAQFYPSADWLVGLTPHLRYNFATGTRWIPFVDAGAGVSATEIGPPDLSGTFEFNLQANLGMQWFMRDDLALSLQVGYLHISDAGIHHPNDGVNCVKVMAGINWFF